MTMGIRVDRETRRQFWLLVRAGKTREQAATSLGLHEWTGKYWMRQAGGVIPLHALHPPSPRYLSQSEREQILVGVTRGESIRQIARRIGRAPSTVLRELRRNMSQGNYSPSLARFRAETRARRPKLAKLAANPGLRELVQAKLEERLSPEQIAAQLRKQFPEDPRMQVSHEAIYQSIYVQGRGALRRELANCLRTGRALRRPQRPQAQRRQRIAGMVSISERPAEVEDRAVPGHWEGDLILGKAGRSAIGTLVERATRFLILLHLPQDHSAAAVQEAMVAATKRLPDVLWKSLTWDQGSEMSNHLQIQVETGLEIYFCDPGKPWQRGSNENTNGLLRQYFPKGTDLGQHGPDYLEFVSTQMNRRPRKTLGWDTPAERLYRLISDQPQAGVATTG